MTDNPLHPPAPWRGERANEVCVCVEDANGHGVCALTFASAMTQNRANAIARLMLNAPGLLWAVEYLLPRAHRHLSDPREMESIASLVAKLKDPT